MGEDKYGPKVWGLDPLPREAARGRRGGIVSGDGGRYRFGPRDRGGALAGWRAGQILTVAVGLVIGVLILRAEPNPAGVAVGVVILVACGAMATWPVSGRTGDEWIPVVVCWGTRRAGARGRRSMDALAGLRLLGIGTHDMGVVHDRRGRTLTAALSLRGQGFALLGPDEQDRRVAGWSSVLASLAREGSPIRRVQWLAASFPDQGFGVRNYLSADQRADPGSAPVASYEALLTDIDADACTHDVVLAVQVRLTKSVETGAAVLRARSGLADPAAGGRRRRGRGRARGGRFHCAAPRAPTSRFPK